jgi:epoxyqueuosine reductase
VTMAASLKSATRLVRKALEFGASSAGLIDSRRLENSPSYQACGADRRLAEPRSVLVLALAHHERHPELDWWDGRKGTAGNRVLIQVIDRLVGWLQEKYAIGAYDLPYHVERGGIFLKDAAALAGMGTIGRNNLLITPEFGPRVRLRALLIDACFEALPASNFAPCVGCPAPCRQACPRCAFHNGVYSRLLCNGQMKQDEANISTVVVEGQTMQCTRYCRVCELACPVGL